MDNEVAFQAETAQMMSLIVITFQSSTKLSYVNLFPTCLI
jgi:hypothetical protein